MDTLFISDSDILESLQVEFAESPEELLCRLEDLLESGDISIDELANYLTDLQARN